MASNLTIRPHRLDLLLFLIVLFKCYIFVCVFFSFVTSFKFKGISICDSSKVSSKVSSDLVRLDT